VRYIRWPGSRGFWRSPLFWLAVLYVLVGLVYVWVTPMLEKPDEEGHYGYIRYLREHKRLPPLYPSEALLASGSAGWLAESKQPPLYYVVAAALTGWLPDITDADHLLVLNPYMDFSVPGYRNDNRNQYLHPPDSTPVVLGSRLVSLAFGLGTMLVSYWLARQLYPYLSFRGKTQPDGPLSAAALVPFAVAAVVGFHPNFLYIATAVNNDAAIVFLSTLIVAVLVYRLQTGRLDSFPVLVGALLGLTSLTKVSGLVLFPLVGLALLLIHRGINRALIKDGVIILAIAFLIGGWWYVRNAVSYGDPFTIGVHTSDDAAFRPFWGRLGHDLAGIEHTFWANPARTFVSEIWLDKILIWWGRISLVLLIAGIVLNWSNVRATMPLWVMLSSWPLTFFFLLVVYWNSRYRWPFGRLLFPSLVPLLLLLVWGWQLAFPRRWRRPFTALGTGALVAASILIPFISIYPLYRPWRGKQAEQVEQPVDIVYVDANTGEHIAKLVGYSLPEPYAHPGTYFPIELCWQPVGHTDVPHAVFVQLLDLSQLSTDESPAMWGRRETYPGLGNLPTDRWTLGETFCDTLMTWIYSEAPTPLRAAIEVGFVDPETGKRLQPVDPQGQPLSLAVVGDVSLLSLEASPVELAFEESVESSAKEQVLYLLDKAIGLKQVQYTPQSSSTLALTLTWQSLRPVPYDATVFIHLRGPGGSMLTQVDRQPLGGRFPTSYWLPGQIITDVVSLPPLPETVTEPLTLNIGMYTWPSLERLPVTDASGMPQQDNAIVIDVPPVSGQTDVP
jgi:hypothetical protein